jgi:actin-related protein
MEIGDPLYISSLGFLYPELFLPYSESDHENRENTFEEIDEKKKKEKKKKERKSIDEMIIDSIEKSEVDILSSNKKKAKIDVLLVGGNSLIPGLPQILETKLTDYYTKKYPEATVKVNVMNTSIYFEPKFSSWKGASIITLLESSK